ncbi:YlxM family DNA-binding protein [Lachnoclostridium phytofermentans]|uniref:UPF0122 protein Cphy_2410 n=1 Tax=Lachnoclostridium phytofermentans (strain ATCC 700394 / DSM 18823 / ISDg) TaxID=357809 RepID=A9KLM7_LACP7|nr:sigma factor-like helix-turn-helix DNA-binding protein [Lachnoclostridium phytofermentans]ABX42771.1 putative helix-turn-helix protein YlxM/p13 family protein [Lachnoclostridium phytofermentans ISDg]
MVLENSKREDDRLQEVVTLSMLFDFYGELLGDHKKQVFSDYILNDYSLSEIADDTGLSRQGVHDIIKRCTRKLKEYEEKLRLVEKFNSTKQKVNQIKRISEEIKQTKDLSKINIVEQLSDDILNDL